MAEREAPPPEKESSGRGYRFWLPLVFSASALAISGFSAWWQYTSHQRARTSEIHDLKSEIEEHFQRGELEAARRDIREATIKAPRSAEVWVLDGWHHALTGNPQQAERLFLQALHKRPKYAPAHFHLGWLLREQGELERARRHLEEALAIVRRGASDIGHALILVNLGDVYYAQRNVPEAKKLYLRALSEDPVNPVAHARMGEVYLDEKRYEESLEEYGKALASDPENPDYLRGAALVLYLTEDFPRAENSIRRSLQIRESAKALELLALILEDLEKNSENVRERLEGLRSGTVWLGQGEAGVPDGGAGGADTQEPP